MTRTKTLDSELKRHVDTFREKAQKIIDRIGCERDKLRELVAEYEEVLSSCDDAIENFDSGMDRLSEHL